MVLILIQNGNESIAVENNVLNYPTIPLDKNILVF